MGGDGGSIPKRCELIKSRRKQAKDNPAFKLAAKWHTCQLTQRPLKRPIVACKLGRLYNKEAILEAKLSKLLNSNEITKHIKTLSDVKELKLTQNKAFRDEADKGDEYKDYNEAPYMCPITSLPMNGIHNFYVNWPCGCVFSEKAMQELKSATCYGCNGKLDPADLIMLYPNEELFAIYEKKIAEERAQKIKAKKEQEKKFDQANEIITVGPSSSSKPQIKTEPKEKEAKSFGWHKNPLKVEVPKKAREMLKRKFAYDTIQDDPNVSKSVKSLFTSSEEAKKQPTAHWVTHNPLYY